MGTVDCEEHCAREKTEGCIGRKNSFSRPGFTATPRAKLVTQNGRNEETVQVMHVTTRKVTATPRDKTEWKYIVYLRNI